MHCFKSFKFGILIGLIVFPSWVLAGPPIAEGYVIGPKNGEAPFTVKLSAIESKGISSYIWQADNGISALNSTTEMTFKTPGSFEIFLEVVDTEGLRNSSPVATVTVDWAMTDSGYIEKVSEDINLTFKFGGEIPDGPVEFYPGDTFDLSLDVEWNIPDGDCTTVYGLWVAFSVPETVLELLGVKEVIHPEYPLIFLTQEGLWFIPSQAQNPVAEILNLEHSFKAGNLLDNPYQNTFDIVKFQLEDDGIPEGQYPFYAVVLFQNEKGIPCGEPLGIGLVEDVNIGVNIHE